MAVIDGLREVPQSLQRKLDAIRYRATGSVAISDLAPYIMDACRTAVIVELQAQQAVDPDNRKDQKSDGERDERGLV